MEAGSTRMDNTEKTGATMINDPKILRESRVATQQGFAHSPREDNSSWIIQLQTCSAPAAEMRSPQSLFEHYSAAKSITANGEREDLQQS
ncbi:hypothetical protein JOB18_048366 [Solea senegalensis]|uniref:Uncharacterized protein n=1 Tax=Solea senegalensis TaxID=28829 RepID=A0AAV6SR14_SOLSE|nr:hypothetical protein JOB18_048366 [Solea senegalensis]